MAVTNPFSMSLATYKSSILRWTLVLVVASVFFYFQPLFHIVSLNSARQHALSKSFDVLAFVDEFWHGPLLESARSAVDIAKLHTALQEDPADAAARYGHQLGLGGSTAYLVSGHAWIVAVTEDVISLSLEENGPASVLIELGPVFGNAIRDGSGVLNVSHFSNTRDFNAISSEINRRVEEQVLAQLQSQAQVGAALRFVGGLEISATQEIPSVLTVVPVDIKFL